VAQATDHLTAKLRESMSNLILTGVGSAMGGRANAVIEAKDAKERKAKAQATWDGAKAELDALTTAKPSTDLHNLIDNAKADLAKLPALRPVAEIEALIRGAAMHPNRGGGCTAVNGSLRMSCPKLEAEKARAVQRERLTTSIATWTADIARTDQRRVEQREKAKAAMDKAAAELAKSRPARVANSDAVALASYLQGLGLNIDADRANKLLVLLAVLVIECGGGLSLAVGMALSEKASGDQTEHTEATHSRTEKHPSFLPKSCLRTLCIVLPCRREIDCSIWSEMPTAFCALGTDP
jgi:hypothetical protein